MILKRISFLIIKKKKKVFEDTNTEDRSTDDTSYRDTSSEDINTPMIQVSRAQGRG